MILDSPVTWLQNRTNSARVERVMLNGLLSSDGVVGTSDYVVSATSTPSMAVQVASGQAWVRGSATGQGAYSVTNDAFFTLSLPTADSAPRIDLIVLKVYDSAYGGSLNAGEILLVKGVPATSPAVPALPTNAIPLATVSVAAGASAVTNSNIVDSRRMALFRSEFTSNLFQNVPWTTITNFGPNAAPYGGAYKVPSVRRLVGKVELSGLIRIGTSIPAGGGSQTIFTLPYELRPIASMNLPIIVSNQIVRTYTVLNHFHNVYEQFATVNLFIQASTGNFIVQYNGAVPTGHWVSLDGLAYYNQ